MVGYVWQQPVDLLIVLSASILMSYIPSSFLEPDWFTLNVDQILSFPCLKHTRTFPSQNKVWGLSYGLLAPFMFWHPAISLTSFPTTLFAHSASFLLSFLLIFKSSQVYSFPEGCALADTAMNALLTDTSAPHSGHLFNHSITSSTLFELALTTTQQHTLYFLFISCLC